MRIFVLASFAVFISLAGCRDAQTSAPPAKTEKAAVAAQPDQPASQAVPTSFAQKPTAGTTAKCPISGEVFEVDEDTVFVEHEGRTYAFCCASCDEEFLADPAKFAAK